MKINAVPALVIGGGLALILFATGGTDNPLNYVVLIVSILCMSLFFSIHYLTIYYLLQPYNAGTELKSGTYRIVLSVTYVACFAAPYADYDLWNYDDCILRTLQYCCQHFGISPCAENL
jgi:hypothetical protein